MPLDPQEAIALSPKAVELAQTIASATAPDGDGGKRVTRAELGRIVRLAVALVGELLLQVLD